jgi:hypothetical protein
MKRCSRCLIEYYCYRTVPPNASAQLGLTINTYAILPRHKMLQLKFNAMHHISAWSSLLHQHSALSNSHGTANK